MIRYFNIEASDIVSYDDETEEWCWNEGVEGNMSEPLARVIKTGLQRYELQEDDALAILARSPTHPKADR